MGRDTDDILVTIVIKILLFEEFNKITTLRESQKGFDESLRYLTLLILASWGDQ